MDAPLTLRARAEERCDSCKKRACTDANAHAAPWEHSQAHLPHIMDMEHKHPRYVPTTGPECVRTGTYWNGGPVLSGMLVRLDPTTHAEHKENCTTLDQSSTAEICGRAHVIQSLASDPANMAPGSTETSKPPKTNNHRTAIKCRSPVRLNYPAGKTVRRIASPQNIGPLV